MRQLRQAICHDIRDVKVDMKTRFDEITHFVTEVQKQVSELRNSSVKTRDELHAVKQQRHHQPADGEIQAWCYSIIVLRFAWQILKSYLRTTCSTFFIY